MEMMVKKFQQKYARVRDEMGKWDDLQSRLISQFSNATSIIERLQVIFMIKSSNRTIPMNQLDNCFKF